jgi:hypothetical protein
MTKEVIYRYLGTNGIIESPVHLEDAYYVRFIRLTAKVGYILKNGDKKAFSITVPEEDVSLWEEVLDEN